MADTPPIETLRSRLATLSTTDVVRMTDTMRDAFQRRIKECEHAIMLHERFGRPDKAAQNIEWAQDNERYLEIAELLHRIAVELSAEEFARAFWNWRAPKKS